MAVSVLCLFLTVPGVGLQCVNVVFAGHTHLLFDVSCDIEKFHLPGIESSRSRMFSPDHKQYPSTCSHCRSVIEWLVVVKYFL